MKLVASCTACWSSCWVVVVVVDRLAGLHRLFVSIPIVNQAGASLARFSLARLAAAHWLRPLQVKSLKEQAAKMNRWLGYPHSAGSVAQMRPGSTLPLQDTRYSVLKSSIPITRLRCINGSIKRASFRHDIETSGQRHGSGTVHLLSTSYFSETL